MLPVAILAGGLGTRLGKISHTLPKSLISINQKPFIYWQLQMLQKNRVTNIVLCISHLSEQIRTYVGDGSKWGVRVQYSEDGGSQLGTGGALVKALPLLGERFGVLYGDSYLPTDYKIANDSFLNSGKECFMTLYKNDNLYDRSNVIFSQNIVTKYEKNSPDIDMKYIDYGLSYFKSKAFTEVNFGESFDLAKLLQYWIKRGCVGALEVHTRFYEVGSVNGINQMNEFIRGNQNGI